MSAKPFRISATVQGECSECPFSIVDGSAEFDAPFYIYDINLNLVGTISSPSDAQPAPEPTTLINVIAGLAVLFAPPGLRLLMVMGTTVLRWCRHVRA
jgi:hypothetical protein